MLSASYSFEAIGTQWSIETDRPLSPALKQRIWQAIEAFDEVYSRFRDDSLVSQMRRAGAASFTFPASITPLFTAYRQLHELTAGKINPLVGTSLERLGYDKTYSFRSLAPMPAPAFGQVSLNGTELTSHGSVLLDIGAIGKGYLVDMLSELVAAEHTDYVVDGSGDMRLRVDSPQIIGLEHPADASRVIGTVALARGSLCASATNRRAWGDGLHHIVDATTGRPLETDIVAVWAITDTAMRADALATGLFFVAPARLQAVFGDFSYVIMRADGSVEHTMTPGVGELFV